MPSKQSKESLKRKREGYQLSMHQCVELKQRRYARTESLHPHAASVAATAPAAAASSLLPHTFPATEPELPDLYRSGHAYLSSSTSSSVLPTTTGAGFAGRGPHAFNVTAASSNTFGNQTYSKPSFSPFLASERETASYPSSRFINHNVGQQVTEDSNRSDELVLRLRPVRVDVVRGDTGRRSTFVVQPLLRYTWHYGNYIYNSLDGEEVGVELRETIVCNVLHSPAIASPCSSRSSSSSSLPVSYSAFSAQDVSCSLLGSQHAHFLSSEDLRHDRLHGNEEAATAASCATCAVLAPRYSYESTQVSRRLTPPSPPTTSSTDVMSHLGSCSASLLVECLLKCIHDEAHLADDQGWVYLYHGRNMVTDIGRTRLLTDLFWLAYFPSSAQTSVGGGALPTLTVCVFRKY